MFGEVDGGLAMACKILSATFVVLGPILFLGFIGEDEFQILVVGQVPPLWVSAGGAFTGLLMAVVGAWMRRER